MKRSLSIAVLTLAAITSSVAGQPADELTPERAFALLKTYDFAQPRAPLAFLEKHIARATETPEGRRAVAAQLGALLVDPAATPAAKRFVCRQLLVVGTAEQVPPLVAMLREPATAEMARQALAGIPGEESLKALRGALGVLRDTALVGVINSLGNRRDGESVAALGELLGGTDSEVVAAALHALGAIATLEAAAVLTKATVPKECEGSLRDAQLRCAQRLVSDGENASALALYRHLLEAQLPTRWLVGALSGMAEVEPKAALQIAVDLMDSPDVRLSRQAMQVAGRLPGAEVTTGLTDRLGQLEPAQQAALLAVLAERGDRAAASAVGKLTAAADESVRVAAVRALGALGDRSTVDLLAQLAAAETGAVQEAARQSLARLAAPDVEAYLLAAVVRGEPGVRAEPGVCAELIRAVAARQIDNAGALLLAAARDKEAAVRGAALSALAVVGRPADYPQLVQCLLSAADGTESETASRAVARVAARIPNRADRARPLIAALDGASAEVQKVLLDLLSAQGGPEALAAVRSRLTVDDLDLRTEAIRALSTWPDTAPATDLLVLAKDADSEIHRALALRGYVQMATRAATSEERVSMLGQVRALATTTAAKNLLLSGLMKAPNSTTLDVALSFVEDEAVQAEATAAALRIAKALLKTDRAAILQPMKALADGADDEATAKQARALYAEALKQPASERSRSAALQPTRKRSEAYRKALAERAPEGYHLASYLDCGPDRVDGRKGAPSLRTVTGDSYAWQGGNATADQLRFLTIVFTTKQVTFQVSDLHPRRDYQLGFSWWDYDHNTRAQSVWASAGVPARQVKLLDRTKLPAAATNAPAEHMVALPRELTGKGTMQIAFRNEGSPNVVVSEVWLWESDAQSDVKAAAPVEKRQGTRVLLVTGVDMHNWRATTPVLVEQLENDKRLVVEVVEDPNFLADQKIHDYPVMVMHWMNWKVPAPGQEARDNFAKYVRDGGGLVLVHFACGAFQDWPEFVNLAGRVWDPKLRGHDPHGKFQVDLTEVEHPITRGLKPFETTDELYTCLVGEEEIEVLAAATSKVDKKVYPMAFVHRYGEGRVFHCVLGHDAKALEPDAVGELFRRGTAWAAGLAPVARAAAQ